MIDKIPNLVLVAIGGIVGSITRYGIGLILNSNKFPLATLFVNLIGSFLLGFIVSMHEQERLSSSWLILLGVGFMGSLTTMSSFAVETINSGTSAISTVNILITLIGVLVGALLGKLLAFQFFS